MLYGVGRFLIEFLRNDYRGSIGIFFHITDYLFWNRGARNCAIFCDSEDDGEERVNAETKIEG